MNEYQQIILQKQKRRYELLLEYWKASEGSEEKPINSLQVARDAGFEEDEEREIYQYFKNEGLLWKEKGGGFVCLSHKAIVEIENSITNPLQSTEHFPSTVIQNFNAPVGSVQTGNHNIANVNQNFGQNLSEILQQLAILRNEFQILPISEREEAIEIVDALEDEVKSETPSKGKIKSFLLATKDFAVKTGTEATSKILVELIKSQIGISGFNG